uniref:Mechanosensitive ion channel family protein n=1 Tax=Steinernema glaseri TaxID=37863 RepID=A0A1I7Z0D8_9BILA
MASVTEAQVVPAPDAARIPQVDDALRNIDEKMSTVSIENQGPKYAGRFDVQLGAITQHNVLVCFLLAYLRPT